jgi:hypothetical protein
MVKHDQRFLKTWSRANTIERKVMESNTLYKNGIPQFDGKKVCILEHKDEDTYTGTWI